MLLDDGSVRIFGINKYGQCDIPFLGERRVVQTVCGFNHTCLVLDDGSIRLIGKNQSGQCSVP